MHPIDWAISAYFAFCELIGEFLVNEAAIGIFHFGLEG